MDSHNSNNKDEDDVVRRGHCLRHDFLIAQLKAKDDMIECLTRKLEATLAMSHCLQALIQAKMDQNQAQIFQREAQRAELQAKIDLSNNVQHLIQVIISRGDEIDKQFQDLNNV